MIGLAFASPFIVGFLFLFAYPIAASAYYSFTDFNLFQAPEWVGLDNYTQMFADGVFWKSSPTRPCSQCSAYRSRSASPWPVRTC